MRIMKAQSLILAGGTVNVFDAKTSVANAVLVEDGMVAAVGSLADVRSRAKSGTREIDIGNAAIFPGLIDTHPHLLHYGSLQEPLVDILDAKSHDDIVSRIRARADQTPAGEWIMTTPVGDPHYFIERAYRD